MRYRKSKSQAGFTIIELLIATIIFSIVLVIFLMTFLLISQLFYKGVNTSRTQEAARNTLQDITDDIQFYHEGPRPSTITNYFCIGTHRYTATTGVKVITANPVMQGIYREDVGSSCFPPTGSHAVNYDSAQQLLDDQMQLNALGVSCSNGICKVHLRIIFYGDDYRVFTSKLPSGYNNDLNSPSYNAYLAPDAQCTGSPQSNQFCAVADYNSTVLQSF